MINPRNLSYLQPDVFSGNSTAGAKALRKTQLEVGGTHKEGSNAFDLTKQRIIMENQVFGKLDFTQDLKKNLDRIATRKETRGDIIE